MKKRTGLLGGTFNPVHVGHLRLALESAERLELDRVVLMPNALPAHKGDGGLLPFSLRVELLRAATSASPRLEVTTLEDNLPRPSYTWNSLEAWNRQNPDEESMFVLGAEDFAGLDSWYKGTHLPELMDFVVMARAGAGRDLFQATIRRLWPDVAAENPGEEVRMASGHLCRFILMPVLDISASLIREKWLLGQDIRFLVPDPVLTLLDRNRRAITRCWDPSLSGPSGRNNLGQESS